MKKVLMTRAAKPRHSAPLPRNYRFEPQQMRTIDRRAAVN